MHPAGLIAVQSIPVAAAIVFGAEKTDPWLDLFLVAYIALLGLILSLVALAGTSIGPLPFS